MNLHAKIYIAGHRGLVGSALVRALTARGYNNLLTRTSQELDLRDQQAVRALFDKELPEYVFVAAAKVGGILANSTYPAAFIYENLQIQNHLIHESMTHKVTRLLFLGSSCIYPRACPQPIKEEYLLTGPLEPTNSPYAIAKIAGIEMCSAYNRQYQTDFLSAMPTNLYGPGDNYDLQNSHVLPALIRKMREAKETVTLWGTGSAKREFLHSDDLADALIMIMQLPDAPPLINVGSGQEITIRDLATLVAKAVGFKGEILWDTTKPDGTPRKLLDISRITALGWKPKISLEEGIHQICASL